MRHYEEQDLVVFLGHADDANDLADALRERLEGALDKEVDRLARVAGEKARWKRVQVYDWKRNAVGEVGGQGDVIDPILERADVAVFPFRWRAGKVTWERELGRARERAGNLLVYCAFPDEPPPREVWKDRERAAAWADLLDKKESLTQGYVAGNASCVVALPDYTDADHLFELLLEHLKPALADRMASPPSRAAGATAAPTPMDLSSYVRRMEGRYGRLDLEALLPPEREEGLSLRLPDVFVEPSVRDDAPPLELPKELLEKLQQEGSQSDSAMPSGMDEAQLEHARAAFRERPRQLVLDAIGRSGAKQVVLLGDPGSGKSTLTRFLLLSLLDPAGSARVRGAFPGAVPLLVELKQYTARCEKTDGVTFLEFLEWLGKTEGYGLSQATLDALLEGPIPVVMIFDGLDEIFDPVERDTIIQRIAGFASDYPNTQVIVTSRILGYQPAALRDAGFAHFTLQDLDAQQVIQFARTWFSRVFPERPDEADIRIERIRTAVEDVPSIRQLAGNPMLLTIMAIISKHQELPRDRSTLYKHASDVLVQHWDVQKRLRDEEVQADYIGKEEKLDLLRRIAWRMQSGEGGLAGNVILGAHLQDEIARYLREKWSEPPARAKTVADAMIRQLRERNFILCRYGGEVYGFVHRSFLEYFCATAILHRFKETQELSLDALRTDVFGKHWEEPAWDEVLRLIVGQLDPKFAAVLIDFLTVDAYPKWPKVFKERPPRNLVLATACLGEVRNLTALEETGTSLLMKIIELLRFGVGVEDADRNEMLSTKLLAAADQLGTQWPGRAACRTSLLMGDIPVWAPLSGVWCELADVVFADDASLEARLQELTAYQDFRVSWPALVLLQRRFGAESVMLTSFQNCLYSMPTWAFVDPSREIDAAVLEPLVRATIDAAPGGDASGKLARFLAHLVDLPEMGVILSRDVDDFDPFVSAAEAVSAEHLVKARRQLGWTEAEMDAYLDRSVPLLGWDVRKGYPKLTDEPTAEQDAST